MRGVVCECGAGRARRDEARVERELRVGRLVPVMREQLRGRERGEVAVVRRRRECFGPPRVQPGALDREQLPVHGLGHQHVAEPDRVALDREHVQVDGLAHRGGDLGELEPDDRGERFLGDRRACHCHGARNLPCRLGGPPEAREHDVAQRSVERTVGAGRARRAELLDDERVAARTVEDLRHRDRVDIADERLDQAGDLGRAEGRHRNWSRKLRAGDLGQELAHRVLTGQFVVATGHHQPDGPVDHVPGQNGQDLARPAVGPVHVLDDDEQRIGCARRVAQREQFLEHLLARQPGDARCRYAVAVTPRGTHQLDERRVSQRFTTDCDASAGEHGRSHPRRVGQQRLDQS